MLPREEVRQVLTGALAFLCPSVYEPLGIVNLEAMACETAVVASNVGGIPEVVLDGETGIVVPYDVDDAAGFERGIAEAVNRLAADPDLAATFRSNRTRAGGVVVRLGRDRRADRRPLPLPALVGRSGPGLPVASRARRQIVR